MNADKNYSLRHQYGEPKKEKCHFSSLAVEHRRKTRFTINLKMRMRSVVLVDVTDSTATCNLRF